MASEAIAVRVHIGGAVYSVDLVGDPSDATLGVQIGRGVAAALLSHATTVASGALDELRGPERRPAEFVPRVQDNAWSEWLITCPACDWATISPTQDEVDGRVAAWNQHAAAVHPRRYLRSPRPW